MSTVIIDFFWRDVRFAVRTLRRSPGVTVAVILTLMLGIGANAALFAVVYEILLKPLPYREPERLVFVAEHGLTDVVGAADYLQWRGRAHSFESLAAFAPTDQTLTRGGDALPVRAVMFAGTLRESFGVSPAKGRDFLREEVDLASGGPPRRVALISDRFLQQQFGGGDLALGATLVMNNVPFIVIGVLPPGFGFEVPSLFGVQREADAIVNMPFDIAQFRGRGPAVQVLGRLRQHVTLETARAELETIRADIAKQRPTDSRTNLRVMLLRDRIAGGMRRPLLILWVAAGFVLLVACVNISNLLLVRAAARRKEMAIRAALGAAKSRLIKQLLTESILLALAGGAAGIVFAFWALRLLLTISPMDVPRIRNAAIDWNVLVFCLAVGLLTGILSGLAPAWSGSRTDPAVNLNEGGRSSSILGRRHSLQDFLVVAELALTLVLLSGAGLMLKSLWVIRSQTMSFAPELVLNTSINSRQIAGPHNTERYIDDLVSRIQRIPGVRAAAASGCGTVPFRIYGLPNPPSERGANLNLPCVSPQYSATLGLRLLSGRWFNDRDRKGSPPVAVVNEATERAYLRLFSENGSIIGKRIDTGGPGTEFPTIVGVVNDFRWRPDADPEMAAFVSSAQVPFRGMATLLVRTSSDPIALANSVRKLVSRTPGVSMVRPETLEDRLSAAIAPRKFQAVLLGIFAGMALLLAMVGTYGVLSYSVTERTHEIGIRMALGAGEHDVLANVVGRAAKLILIGVALGCMGSVSLARWINGLLYGVKPTDTVTYVSVSALLIAVALFAAYLPARRAVRIDPMLALRYD